MMMMATPSDPQTSNDHNHTKYSWVDLPRYLIAVL